MNAESPFVRERAASLALFTSELLTATSLRNVRVTGSMAVYLMCPNCLTEWQLFGREPHDVDLICSTDEERALARKLSSLGYHEPPFAPHQESRLTYLSEERKIRVEIHLPPFTNHFNHQFLVDPDDLFKRGQTVSLEFLMLSKLQFGGEAIEERRNMDLVDLLVLFTHWSQTEAQTPLQFHRIAAMMGGRWGFWQTVVDNLDRLEALALNTLSENKLFRVQKSVCIFRRELMKCRLKPSSYFFAAIHTRWPNVFPNGNNPELPNDVWVPWGQNA